MNKEYRTYQEWQQIEEQTRQPERMTYDEYLKRKFGRNAQIPTKDLTGYQPQPQSTGWGQYWDRALSNPWNGYKHQEQNDGSLNPGLTD